MLSRRKKFIFLENCNVFEFEILHQLSNALSIEGV